MPSLPILLGLSPLGGGDLHFASRDLLRRLQGRGAYSTDEASNRDRELLAWAELHALSRQRLDAVAASVLPDQAVELLRAWEAYLRAPNNAPLDDSARQARAMRFANLVSAADERQLFDLVRAITSAGTRNGVGGFSGADYYADSTTALAGTNTMTRSVLLRVDATPSAQVLVGQTQSGVGGWYLGIDSAARPEFVVFDGATAYTITSTVTLTPNRFYAISASFDGDLRLAVNREIEPTVGAILTPAAVADLTLGNSSDGSAPASSVTILGAALSDSVALADPALREVNRASLEAGTHVGFAGVQSLYLAPALGTDTVGSNDLAAVGSPVPVAFDYSSAAIYTPTRATVTAGECSPETILHFVVVLSELDYQNPAKRKLFDILSRVIPQRSLGQMSRATAVDEQLVTVLGAEWSDTVGVLDKTCLANDAEAVQPQRRNPARYRDYGPLSRVAAADLNGTQEAFVFEGAPGISGSPSAEDAAQRFFAAELAPGVATPIDTSVDWRDRIATAYLLFSKADIRPGAANDSDANDPGNEYTIPIYTGTGEVGVPGAANRYEALIASDSYIRSNTSGDLEIFNDDISASYVIGCVVASGDTGER